MAWHVAIYMCRYVPYNGPICVAMIMSSTTPTMLFWNWVPPHARYPCPAPILTLIAPHQVNQSQNAAVNYFNRNASSNMSNETMVDDYMALAVLAVR